MCLVVDDIRAQLNADGLPIAVRYFPVVDSTNRVAHDLLINGPTTWTVVLTNFQTRGRGRLGRSWNAPPGTALLQSVIIPLRSGSELADVMMLAALSVRDAIAHATKLVPRLKWPNDTYLGDRKIAGILAEAVVHSGRTFAIVGIGINVSLNPAVHPDVPQIATSLELESGQRVVREDVAVSLYRSLFRWNGVREHDPHSVFDEWRRALKIEGRRLTVQDSHGSWPGQAVSVNRDGSLLILRDDGSEQRVYAANVSVR